MLPSGKEYAYKYPEFVKRVVNLDVGNNPEPPPFPPSDVYFNFLTFYQQDAIRAYLAADDAAMDANVRASARAFGGLEPPCADCAVAPDATAGVGYRTGWMHRNFVNPDPAWTDALSDVPIDEWEFFFTPSWPDDVPVLFLWATEGFHSPGLLEWLDARGDGSGHRRMGEDHWFPARGGATDTNDAMARFFEATDGGTDTGTTTTEATTEATTTDATTTTTAASTAVAEPVPELCTCSPLRYTLRLSLTQPCGIDDLDGNEGVDSTLCTMSVTGAPPPPDRPAELVVVSVQFLELGTDAGLTVINQDDSYRDTSLKDGDALTFDSVAGNLDPGAPLGGQVDLVPGAVQVTLVGRLDVRNDDGTTESAGVEQRVTWAYTNGCDDESLPVADGDRIGWITFVSCVTLQLLLATIKLLCCVARFLSFFLASLHLLVFFTRFAYPGAPQAGFHSLLPNSSRNNNDHGGYSDQDNSSRSCLNYYHNGYTTRGNNDCCGGLHCD